MSERWRGVAIIVLAVAAVLVFALLALLMTASGLTCEDAEDAALQTVRCDSERGAGWRTLRASILLLGGAGLLAGVVLALSRASFRPLAATGAAAVVGLFAAGAINDIELGDKPVPSVTAFRVLDGECRAPCADGFRVAVTVDEPAELVVSLGPARFEDIGDRQFATDVNGDLEVPEGTHELRVRGRIRNPPSESGPLPPGAYELDVRARPQDAGNQPGTYRDPISRRVTVRP